jgi:hypothetical protein
MPTSAVPRRPDLTPRPYRLLRSAVAPKLSARPGAGVAYLWLADEPDASFPDLFLAVVGNVGGGGLWSKEAVPLASILASIAAYLSSCADTATEDARPSFPTRALAAAFAGRSNNNAPFLAACLRDLGLLTPSPDTPHQHQLT